MTDTLQHQGPDQCYPSDSYIAWLPDQAVKLRADDEDIASNPPVSVVTAFTEVAEKYPDNISLVDSYNDTEDVYTYKRFYDSVVHLAKAFIKLGLKSSHGVGIIGFNSPQWIISYLGTIFAGGITVGMNQLLSENAIRFIADNARCNVIVVEDDELLQSILKLADDLPHLKAIIQYRGQPTDGHKDFVFSWKEIMEMHVEDDDEELKRRIGNIGPNKCCTILSTSGTTGIPKLVMCSHDNITYHVRTFFNRLNKGSVSHETVVSYLPLGNIGGLMVDISRTLISSAGTVHFTKNSALRGSLVESIRKVRPTLLFGIPRVWEMLLATLVDLDKNTLNANEDPLSIKAKLGLDRCHSALIGGAPCRKEMMEFFKSRGIALIELYGMTESTGGHITNTSSNSKESTVGKPVPGFNIRLQDHGVDKKELLLNGRNIFMGYLSDETLTREAFDEDFWFRTGDTVKQDEDGFITLTGRIKELIITSIGENIPPTPIEMRVLKELPCLSHCILFGEGKNFLSMLLTFKSEIDPTDGKPTDDLAGSALHWCQRLGSKAKKVSEILASQDPLIMNAIQKGIDKANEKAYSKTHCIQKWMILPRDFSMTGGELGPTMKMKRKEICKMYQKDIESFY